jgi:hypothetical protein
VSFDDVTSESPTSDVPTSAQPPSANEVALRVAVLEVEQHASGSGWDQPARLFALVPTVELAAAEPELAAQLGIRDGSHSPLTPVEQELDDLQQSLEQLLGGIVWPDAVVGALAVLERVVLPPQAEADVPDDPEEAARYAAEHAEAEDVRIAVGVLRSGESHCIVRMRSHDSDDELIHGAAVVPGLVEVLRETLVA